MTGRRGTRWLSAAAGGLMIAVSFIPIGGGSNLLATPAGATTPICSASSSGPALGVYAGAGSSSGVASFESATRTTEQWASDYLPGTNGFSGMSDASAISFVLNGWQGSGCQLILGVPIIPTSHGSPSGTLADGAAGDYNSYFTTLAQSLVNAGDAGAYLRLGWEFDGPWFAWNADTPTAETNYANYFRQIVTAMRAVSGQNFKFVWNPDAGAFTKSGYNIDLAYPGNSFVDAIALDQYDQSWATPQTPTTAWSQTVLPALDAAQQFATSKGEPLGFAEWGEAVRSDGHGLGDDPNFINQMKQWFDANDVAFAIYFNSDQPPSEYNALTDGRFPHALSAFSSDFGSSVAPGGPGSSSSSTTSSGSSAGSSAASTSAVATTTSLALSSDAPIYDLGLTATVSVTPSSATGTVQLALDGTKVGNPIDLSGGQALVPLHAVAAGSHTLTATYSGSGADKASTGTTTFSVAPDATGLEASTGAVSGPIASDSVIVSATLALAPYADPLPSQRVTFTANDGAGTCSATTDSSGVASCTIALGLVAEVPTAYTAAFSGTTDYQASSGSAAVDDTDTLGQ